MTTEAPLPSGETAPYPVGTLLGRCRLQKIIGQGGMGTVYLAHHEALDKTVAVKVLPRKYSQNSEYVRRFQREARSAAKLEHPNIIQVLDVANDGDVHYIVMQYYEGMDLGQLIDKKGKLAVSDALSITKKVAQALGAAHAAGIVHRDVKPSNIVVTKQGKVLVTDFGLAREITGTMTGNAITQSSGIVLGTPQYISPEQAMGERSDARSDLYSLGATFYAMLAGRPPYDDDNPVSVLMKHVRENEKPESLRKINPEVPEALERLVDKMMAKSPSGRPATMDDVVSSIDLIKGARGTGPVATAQPAKRPGWILAAGGGLLAGMVVMVVVLVLLVVSSAKRDLAAAILAEEEAGTDPARLREAVRLYRDIQSRYTNSDHARTATERADAIEDKLAAASWLQKYLAKDAPHATCLRELRALRERNPSPERLAEIDRALQGIAREELRRRTLVLSDALRYRIVADLRQLLPPDVAPRYADREAFLPALLAKWTKESLAGELRVRSVDLADDRPSLDLAQGRAKAACLARLTLDDKDLERRFTVDWKLSGDQWILAVD